MKHKCDRCSRDATVTEVTVRNGQKIERHLCEQCAAEEGIAIQQPHAPINELITKFVMTTADAQVAPARTPACQTCGLTFADFRQRGLLGCPACYKAFEQHLGPLLERAHEGATHHTGKLPRRAGQSVDRQQRLTVLRKQLTDAIAQEQYERAASLRDELLQVETDCRRQPPEISTPGQAQPAPRPAGEQAVEGA